MKSALFHCRCCGVLIYGFVNGVTLEPLCRICAQWAIWALKKAS